MVDIHEQKKDLPEINFLINKGVQHSNNLHSNDDVVAMVSRYPELLEEVVGLMEIFFVLVRNHNQFLAEKTHLLNWETFLDKLHS